MKILEITIKKEVDDYPDTSFIGEYTDLEEPWTISRRHGEYLENLTEDERQEIPQGGREYRFFKPYAGGEPEGSADFQKYGKQDFERMETLNRGDFDFLGIWAEALIKLTESDLTQTISSGGLWGIESDSPEDYLREIEKAELDGLRRELLAVGFSNRQISRAINEMKAREEG